MYKFKGEFRATLALVLAFLSHVNYFYNQLKLPVLFANRLRYKGKNSFAGRVIFVATITVALGILVMVMAICILQGFTQSIENKIYSLSGQLAITRYAENNADASVIYNADSICSAIRSLTYVRNVIPVAFKPCLIKTNSEIQGVVLKGFIPNANSGLQLSPLLIQGSLPNASDTSGKESICISKIQANLLNIKLNDQVVLYFLQEPPRFRKATITGIYETGLEDQDANIVWCNLALLQQLNSWPNTAAGSVEIHLNHPDSSTIYASSLQKALPYDLGIEPIAQRFAHIFAWLSMIENNVNILTTLIIIVACFNMFSTLLIMILERIPMVGMLKALGSPNSQISQIFIFAGIRIILKGLLYGNVIAIALCYMQYTFHVIPLDPVNYYMAWVPISWNWIGILKINLLTLCIASSTLALCTLFTLRVRPAQAIRFQ
jgi:lipoprotein-releasing system permease protein